MVASSDSDAFLFGFDEPVCPYTGLRTFSEDEAIYFRGREEHVAKCLALLAAERFVMITGASGDGKSSLVFAGLLPEVRAGFLRGQYSSWAVATFRPERSPLRNMALALASALRLENSVAAVESELAQGFSALVQLYQASSLCPPTALPAELPSAQQRQQQLQAANLLLVVDQFEEFFTNPENYAGDGPNTAAQTVVNLLLETTRLAQAESLPIYIVCTMRSDFVGQCAGFRGLIEQIGVSQYFVPRLRRHEFVEVIQEPALLSGNRISKRLVQRLLYDIHYGQDQLPVLQHALRRIWLAANQGREEMDLIHYAMVGGLADELPAADQLRFAQWQASLSVAQREFLLARPSLRNVLDAHANQLYYEATAIYNRDFYPPLPPGTAERVIEHTFRVLTRTNGQRVVRNRLTGGEITAILNDSALPWPVVCRILRPFRQAGTTFLSPFSPEGGDDQEVLPADAVLDITHESLIRNWTHLAEWARSEAEDVRVAQDLLLQATRWQLNAENSGFLLPIGPYSYFAQWNRRKQVNANWLAYYATVDDQAAEPRQASATSLSLTLTQFLEASRRRLRLPLLVAHYGLGRLVTVVLLPALLVGLGWWAWVQRQQQADYVAYTIIKERLPKLTSRYVSLEDKANLLLTTDRLKDFVYVPWLGSRRATDYAFPRQLDELANDSLALNIELSMFSWIDNLDYDSVQRINPYIQPLLVDLDRRLTRAGSISQPSQGRVGLSAHQRELAVCTARLIMALTYYLVKDGQQKVGRPQPLAEQQAVARRFDTTRQRLLARLYRYMQQEVRDTTSAAPNPIAFGFCLRVLLGQGDYRPADLAFLEGLNPFGGSEARRQFRRFFPSELSFYSQGGSTSHSGGYLTSAIVFAARRQPTQLVRCLDVLSGQVTKLNDRDGGIAVLPYLVKYELFTPENTPDLLRRCTRVGGVFSFNEIYAATVYSLLSMSPSYRVYDVTQAYSEATVNAPNALQNGSVNADYLNFDRVSFSVPVASRDKTWLALLAATPVIAAQEPLFIERSERERANKETTLNHYQRNSLFLQAFLAKMHGVYLAELKHEPVAAEQEFAQFSTHLQALKQVHKLGELINDFQWNLGISEALDLTYASSVGQDPVLYLEEPVRPKTQLFETYYTCGFNAFFNYQLRQAFANNNINYQLVNLLDSVAFIDVAFPDRYSGTRTYSLQTQAFNRPSQFLPNLSWLKDLANSSTSPRAYRQTLLLAVAAALQDSAKLKRFDSQKILPFVRQLPKQPTFSQVPFQVAFSDLAAGLAGAGRVADAFTLAEALGGSLETITKIRIGEQVMLTNDQHQQAQLDTFLLNYCRHVTQDPMRAAGSSIALLCWRPYANHEHDATLAEMAGFLIREGNAFVSANGVMAMCKGRTLADESYRAVRDIPAYQSESRRQPYFNTILTGLAYRKNTAVANDGWHEYDSMQLVNPIDYDGPTN